MKTEQEVEAANELARPQLQLQDEKASDVDGDPEPPSAVEAIYGLSGCSRLSYLDCKAGLLKPWEISRYILRRTFSRELLLIWSCVWIQGVLTGVSMKT